MASFLKSGMPKIQDAFKGWTESLTVEKITQSISNGDLVITKSLIAISGTLQPLQAEAIQLKAEGTRNFEWFQLHCFNSNKELFINDVVVIRTRKYKVMDKKNYDRNNYIEYHLIKDFE